MPPSCFWSLPGSSPSSHPPPPSSLPCAPPRPYAKGGRKRAREGGNKIRGTDQPTKCSMPGGGGAGVGEAKQIVPWGEAWAGHALHLPLPPPTKDEVEGGREPAAGGNEGGRPTDRPTEEEGKERAGVGIKGKGRREQLYSPALGISLRRLGLRRASPRRTSYSSFSSSIGDIPCVLFITLEQIKKHTTNCTRGKVYFWVRVLPSVFFALEQKTKQNPLPTRPQPGLE